MTTDKFVRRNQLISQHLDQIAQRRGHMAATLVPASPAFRDLLIAQERLLLAAERLLDASERTAA